MVSNPWREVQADWQADEVFLGSAPSGGSVQIGSFEGKPGISPMELLLLSVAGCTGADIISILHKKKQDLKAMKVTVRGRRAENHPRVFEEIIVRFDVWGELLNENAIAHAIRLSSEKYCSVLNTLNQRTVIRTEYFVHCEAEAKPEQV